MDLDRFSTLRSIDTALRSATEKIHAILNKERVKPFDETQRVTYYKDVVEPEVQSHAQLGVSVDMASVHTSLLAFEEGARKDLQQKWSQKYLLRYAQRLQRETENISPQICDLAIAEAP